MMTVKLEIDPPLEIHTKPLGKKTRSSLTQKVAHVVRESFKSINKSRRTIQRNLIPSFVATVLQTYGSWSLPLLPATYAYRTIMWVAKNTYLFGEIVFVDLYKKLIGNELEGTSIGKIDTRHLKTSQGAFDVSSVPDSITIDTLMTFFTEINFKHNENPNYVDPKNFGNPKNFRDPKQFIKFFKEQTKRNLSIIIYNVKNRVVRLSTPERNTPELEKFYKHIEDGVRLILHEFQKKMDQFYLKHGMDKEDYSPDQKKEYQILLEERLRICIEFSSIAELCGSRYTSETMELWKAYCSQKPKGDLKNQLMGTLASLRDGIAHQRIQERGLGNTHFNNAYFASLGKKLGLTVQKSIFEGLPSTYFNEENELEEFYKLYTPKIIIKAIQDKIKDPNESGFRALIVDWIKAKRGNWMPWSEYTHNALIGTLQRELSEIIQDKTLDLAPKNSSQAKYAESVLELIVHLKKSGFKFPDHLDDWGEFIEDLFTEDPVKEWCNQKFADTESSKPTNPKEEMLERKALMQKRNALKSYLSTECTEEQKELLKSLIQKNPITEQENIISEDDRQKFLSTCAENDVTTQKTQRILEVLIKHEIHQPEMDVLKRIATGATNLNEAVCNLLNAEVEAKFIEALKLVELEKIGLSKSTLKLLLTEHHILTPPKNLIRAPYPLWKRVCLIKIPRLLSSRYVVNLAKCVGFVAGVTLKYFQVLLFIHLNSAIPLALAGYKITSLVLSELPTITTLHKEAMLVLGMFYLRYRNLEIREILLKFAVLAATTIEPFLLEAITISFDFNFFISNSPINQRIDSIKNHLERIAAFAEQN